MERLIRNVTKKYINLLPEGQPFYTPDELKNLELPDFLLQRIDVEIRNRLNESLIPPHSEWTGMASDNVKEAWEQFLEAVVAERRLPASAVSEVIETSVTDLAGLILKPRTEVPSIIFGTETELQGDQIRQRTRFITINTHLAEAILKYMDRRKKKELDIDTCRNIIEKVDERLTHNYSSRDWAKLMEPLYILSGPKVDSELFRIFFDSRQMDQIAHRFDLLTDYLTRERFIEVLEDTGVEKEKREEQEQIPVMSTSSEYAGQIEKNHSQKNSAANTSFFETSEPEHDEEKSPDDEKDQIITKKSKKDKPKETKDSKKGTEADQDEDTLLSSFQGNVKGYDLWDEEDNTETDYFDYYGFQEEEDEDETDEPDKDSEPSLYSIFMDRDEDESVEKLDDEPWDYVDKTEEERTFAGQFEEEEIDEEEFDEKDADHQKKGFDAEEQKDFFEAEETIEEVEEKRKEVELSPEPPNATADSEPEVETDLPEKDDPGKEAKAIPDFEKVEIKDENEVKDSNEVDAEAEDDEVKVDDDVDETFLFGEEKETEDPTKSKSNRPVWQAFLADEDHIDEEDLDDAGYFAFDEHEDEEDDPIMSQLIEAEKKENVEKLISCLKDDEKRFIKTIFDGSQNNYETALIKLDEFDSWKQAASYIGKEIFARNSVNMYDDDAVDFTDRLQEYFEKNKT